MPMIASLTRLVLSSVADADGEAYGLTIRARIKRLTGRTVSTARIYPVLAGLEEKQLIASRNEPGGPERGYYPRRIYQITAAGRRYLVNA
jgi:DNA-binding PadR family transcriptional regulator